MNRKIIHAYVKADGLEVLPDGLKRYADHFNLLQHRILTRFWQWQTDEKTGTYSILKRKYLEAELTPEATRDVLRWAINSGNIERDGRYVEGEKSYGYRMGPELAKQPTRRIPIVDERLVQRVKMIQRREAKNYVKAHRHLRNWLHQLEIDPAAIQMANDHSINELAREANMGAIQMLLDHEFTFSVCDYGRVHTNVTRLLSPLRQYLMLDSQKLVNVDIANSQPLFLAVTLLTHSAFGSDIPSVLSDETDNPMEACRSSLWRPSGPGLMTCPCPDQSHILGTRPPIRSGNDAFQSCNYQSEAGVTREFKMPKSAMTELSEQMIPDVKAYLKTCEQGRLYGMLMEGINWTHGKEAFKEQVWFAFLYGSNKDAKKLARPSDEAHPHRPELKRLSEYFQQTFPTVFAFMWQRKQRRYWELACEMQKAESALMIDRVCARLATERPWIPILTIHDSIMTTRDHVDVVKAVMAEEFARLGIMPTLNVTDYEATYAEAA